MGFWTFAVVFGTGALTVSIVTSIAWAVMWDRHNPGPPRVRPEEIRRLTDALAQEARSMRASHSRGAEVVERLVGESLNLERKARGLPPLSLPKQREIAS